MPHPGKGACRAGAWRDQRRAPPAVQIARLRYKAPGLGIRTLQRSPALRDGTGLAQGQSPELPSPPHPPGFLMQIAADILARLKLWLILQRGSPLPPTLPSLCKPSPPPPHPFLLPSLCPPSRLAVLSDLLRDEFQLPGLFPYCSLPGADCTRLERRRSPAETHKARSTARPLGVSRSPRRPSNEAIKV